MKQLVYIMVVFHILPVTSEAFETLRALMAWLLYLRFDPDSHNELTQLYPP
jgi:hypothetical protein